MEFTIMRDNLIKNFNEITKNAKYLYEVDLDKDVLWNLYLDKATAEGGNEFFRERRELDCSACRHFVKSFGNTVIINQEYEVQTIWGFDCDVAKYQSAMDAMDRFVKEHAVSDLHIHYMRFQRVGTASNYETVENGKLYNWTHFYVDVPNKFLTTSSRSEGDLKGDYRDIRNVFKRSLDEITADSVETVLELIAQNSLYRGKEWEDVLKKFLVYKNEYMTIPEEKRNNYAWVKSAEAGPVIGKIRNHSMGTMLVDIASGTDLETAVRKYEQIVAPTNYKRSNAIFTQKMLDEAKKTLTDLGYMDSLKRRYAKVDDITVNNILYCNRDTAKQIAGEVDIFGEMSKDVKSSPKKFGRIEEIDADKFVADVLPTAQEIELYFENKHAGNMVSLIAPEIAESKNMFKWGNNFSWAYSGNVTDSMKERVKAAGGKVDGDLRFSIQWNDGGEYDGNDLDAHCNEPNGYHIYFGSYKKPKFSPTGGQLDVDIISPKRNTPAVENITWADRKKMKPGKYEFFVHCYSFCGGKSGFRAEIEFDGQIYSFDYSTPMRGGQSVTVAIVELDTNGNFTIKEKLPSATSSRKIWNVDTNQFVPVSAIMFSPNYWEEQNGIGNKHLFFMLKDCVNTEGPNGFFNEYLNEELYQKHRKVMEALGTKLAVADSDNQLSGVGFCMTKRAEVVVKVKGATERILKVKF